MYDGNKLPNMYFGGHLQAASKAALFMYLHDTPNPIARF